MICLKYISALHFTYLCIVEDVKIDPMLCRLQSWTRSCPLVLIAVVTVEQMVSAFPLAVWYVHLCHHLSVAVAVGETVSCLHQRPLPLSVVLVKHAVQLWIVLAS